MNNEVVQLKLVTGEQVIATFTDDNSESPETFRIYGALEMIPLVEESEEFLIESGTEFYIMRPWITYADNLMDAIAVNPATVVYIAPPSVSLKIQYLKSFDEIQQKLGVNSSETDSDGSSSTAANVIAFKPKPQTLTE